MINMVVFCCNTVVFAAVRTIETSGSYVMNTELDETFAVAEERARREAKRAAIEESGFYLKNSSQTINGKLSKDELRVLAAQILKIQDEKVVKKVDGDKIEYTVTIKAVVDDMSVDLKKLAANKQDWSQKVRFDQALQEDYDKIRADNERLKKEYARAKDETNKKRLKAETVRNNRLFEANQYMEKGIELYNDEQYLSALLQLDKALEIDKTNAKTYMYRGAVNTQLKEYRDAIMDLNKAIELNPNDSYCYNRRGRLYSKTGDEEEAIENFNKAIQLKPDYSSAYNNRGVSYANKKNYVAAISDYTKAIKYNPNDITPYNNRSIAYQFNGDIEAAMLDIKKVLAIDPENATAKARYNTVKWALQIHNQGKAKEKMKKEREKESVTIKL